MVGACVIAAKNVVLIRSQQLQIKSEMSQSFICVHISGYTEAPNGAAEGAHRGDDVGRRGGTIKKRQPTTPRVPTGHCATTLER